MVGWHHQLNGHEFVQALGVVNIHLLLHLSFVLTLCILETENYQKMKHRETLSEEEFFGELLHAFSACLSNK